MEIKKQIIKYTIFLGAPAALIIFLLFFIKFNDPDFYIEDLPQKMQIEMINNGAWNNSCPVQLNRLKFVNVKYRSDKNTINKNGKLVMLDAAAPQTIKIFKKLFKKNVFIDKIELPTKYSSHKNSLLDNNSIGFICDKNNLNKNLLNGYGVSLDINPLYNPSLYFIANDGSSQKDNAYVVVPKQSLNFVNRNVDSGKMNEKIAKFFEEFGFTDWGGKWQNNPNFQYFSINAIITQLLIMMKPDDAIKFLDILVDNKAVIDKFNKDEFFFEIKFLYEKNNKSFLKIFKKNIKKLKTLNDSEFFDLLRKDVKNK